MTPRRGRPKAAPPCHCHREGTGPVPGKMVDGEEIAVDSIWCPLHRRWVPLKAAEA